MLLGNRKKEKVIIGILSLVFWIFPILSFFVFVDDSSGLDSVDHIVIVGEVDEKEQGNKSDDDTAVLTPDTGYNMDKQGASLYAGAIMGVSMIIFIASMLLLVKKSHN